MLEDYKNKIEAYLDDELSEEEIERFESFLQSSPDLQEELDAEIATRNILYFDQEERLLETFRGLDIELDKKKRVIVLRNWGIGIAAAISLFFFIFYQTSQDIPNPERSAYASNTLDKALISEFPQIMNQNDNSEKPKIIQDAKSFFDEGNWEELEKIVAKNQEFSIPEILLGITYIKEGEYAKALDFYNSPDLPQRIKPYGDFYKGIIFSLQKDKDTEACAAFQKIIDQDLGDTYLTLARAYKKSISCS